MSNDPIKQAVIDAFKTAAPTLCKNIDELVDRGVSRKTIGHLIDHTAPANTVTNQGAHTYLDSLFGR